MRIFVTGIGITSAIGNNVAENLNSLRAGKTGIGKANFFDSRYADLLPFGEVKLSNKALEAELQLNLKGSTRTELLAFKAFREAIAEYSSQEIQGNQTALISASTVGGMCLTDQLYRDANLKTPSSIHTDYYSAADHNIAIAKAYGISGICDTFNTACSASANAIAYGSRLIKSGRAKRAIVGGVDSLAKFTVNGFNALTILSEAPCKSFDADRNGLNLGEGAAYLVLEGENTIGDKTKLAELSGHGNANDAHHASALSEEGSGVIAAIAAALESASLKPEDISHINMHGTATENNDWCELKGCQEVFKAVPPFCSTKTYTGHTLGASSAIEAVFSILSIQHQELFPTLNFRTPIEPFGLKPITAHETAVTIKHVLSNSFGFSGNCSSLIFSQA